jgi:membrane-bound lytic murein transglycosylase F
MVILKTLATRITIVLIIFLGPTLWLTSCEKLSLFKKPLTQLEQIKQTGTLKVATRIDPTTYYQGPSGYMGLEFELATLFAKQLGVKVQFSTPPTFTEILRQIESGEVDIAAAGLTITEPRQQTMRFAPAYQEITEQIIYHTGTRRPKKVADLNYGILEVVNGTSHIESLKNLQKQVPNLAWEVNNKLDSDGLIYLVSKGLIDYTIADSNQIALIRRFYPKLHTSFSISKPRRLAWALTRSEDTSLYDEVTTFFNKIKQNKKLEQLIDRYYGYSSSLNYFSLCKFREHVKSRLPLYQHLFQEAAAEYDQDWRFLAAIGYQESHWRKNAVSPTGVQGIMMLTKNTAKQLGIKDRTDPVESIMGGTAYFQRSIKKIPERILEPDRSWMALAAYNVGYGHLEDARILTQKQKGNPDRWIDVKKSLPLLTQKKWHKQTKHGYARGNEPVKYVEKIRSYYALLVWLTEENQIEKNVMSAKAEINKAYLIQPSAL